MARQVTQQQFLADVRTHEMTVLHDAGVYRHLRFQKPEHSWHYRFNIVTWPGALCIRGDCGTYVFSRVEDMFSFFRHPAGDGGDLYINEDYWAEKLLASDCNGRRADGVMRFDPDLFGHHVRRHYVDHVRRRMRGKPKARQDLRRALEDEVLSRTDEGEEAAMRAACNFEHDGFMLQDFWECNCQKYTTQFVWSLYAIAWGIHQYDAAKQLEAV